MRRIKTVLFLTVLAALASSAYGQMSLDLNPSDGDQGEHERAIKPGQMFLIDLVAIDGAKGMSGLNLILKFDTSQIVFKGFSAAGLMAGAMSMPPKTVPSGVEFSAAIMGSNTASEGSGSLGHILFKAGPNLTHTSVEIVSANFGSSAGIQATGTGHSVMISNPDAPPPQGDTPPRGNTPPGPGIGTGIGALATMHEEDGTATPLPPEGTNEPEPQGDPNQSGFQNQPRRGSGNQGQGFQNPPPGGSGGSAQQGGNQGRQVGQGRNQGQQGRQGGNQRHQVGQGRNQGQQGRQGGNQGQQGGQMGGNQGHQGGQMQGGPGQGDHQQQMNPEDMIEKLPASLQAAFRQTMEIEHSSRRAHMEAELATSRSILRTLEQTKRFLANASQEDQETVARTLWFFHNQDDGGHDPMGGPGRGGPPGMGRQGDGRGPQGSMGDQGHMGQPGAGMPGDANEMVRRMIQEVEQQIQQLEQGLQRSSDDF